MTARLSVKSRVLSCDVSTLSSLRNSSYISFLYEQTGLCMQGSNVYCTSFLLSLAFSKQNLISTVRNSDVLYIGLCALTFISVLAHLQSAFISDNHVRFFVAVLGCFAKSVYDGVRKRETVKNTTAITEDAPQTLKRGNA